MSEKKTILVTGGAGFVGTNLLRRLALKGERLISLDNYATSGKPELIDGVEYRTGHTKDIEKLVPERVDLLYHLGEYARPEKSFEDIAMVWDLNVVGTFGVLEYWRKTQTKLVYAGSSTKFADGGLGRDQSPYAWTKAANTELVRNYGTWFSLPYAITYFYNVYGPGERSGAFGTVVEIFRQKFLKGEPLGVVSPGTQRRNFTHVDDIVDGLIAVGEKGQGDDFGLGNETNYSILEIAEMFETEITMLPERQGNRMTSSIDTTKSRAIGWSAKKSIAEYIAEIRSARA